jgi:hypothetical protein
MRPDRQSALPSMSPRAAGITRNSDVADIFLSSTGFAVHGRRW